MELCDEATNVIQHRKFLIKTFDSQTRPSNPKTPPPQTESSPYPETARL